MTKVLVKILTNPFTEKYLEEIPDKPFVTELHEPEVDKYIWLEDRPLYEKDAYRDQEGYFTNFIIIMEM